MVGLIGAIDCGSALSQSGDRSADPVSQHRQSFSILDPYSRAIATGANNDLSRGADGGSDLRDPPGGTSDIEDIGQVSLPSNSKQITSAYGCRVNPDAGRIVTTGVGSDLADLRR
jgi:hypothetical protein